MLHNYSNLFTGEAVVGQSSDRSFVRLTVYVNDILCSSLHFLQAALLYFMLMTLYLIAPSITEQESCIILYSKRELSSDF